MNHAVQRLLRIGRNTANLDRALAFHVDALGFCVTAAPTPAPAWSRLPGLAATPSRSARLTLGAQQIELTEFPDGAPCRADDRACELGFQHLAIVVDDMQAAFARALQHGATPITRGGPQTLPPATGSVSAWKFRDPDGHPLELIHFPPGTGDPVWQTTRSGAATLGIDHSAISVGDIERNLKFFGLLGLKVAARGVNHGLEQQRLDGLAGVEVDVIALQPAATRTPHLELLGYRTPRGRAAPAAAPSALGADRLIWQVDGIDALLEAIMAAGFAAAILARGNVDGTRRALLRSPDGHLQLLVGADS